MVFQPGCDQAASTSPIASTQPSFSLTETGTQLVLTSRETNCVPVSVPHLSRRLRRFRYLHRHSDSYRLERPSCRAAIAPTEDQHLFTAHTRSDPNVPAVTPPITTLLSHLHALENALPSNRLVLWPEPQPNAGVDWCDKLRAGGRYTGCGLTSRQKMRTSPESPVKVKKEKLHS